MGTGFAGSAWLVLRLLPNIITGLRLLLLPVFVALVLADRRWAALGVLGAIALSDWLDGFVARRYGAASRAGALLDPAADKLVQLTALALLSSGPYPHITPVPPGFFALVLARDCLLLYGTLRIRARGRRVRVRPRIEGKLSTLLVFLILFGSLANVPYPLLAGLSIVTSVVVVMAAVRYAQDGRLLLGGTPS